MNDAFRKFAQAISHLVGTSWSFMLAITVIVVWAASGRAFGYSDTWQLIINTGTTIVTFLMVFLIQNTQNRDARAIHLKLDELIKSVEGARTRLVDLEDLSDEELEKLKKEFQGLHERMAGTIQEVKEERVRAEDEKKQARVEKEQARREKEEAKKEKAANR